MNRRGLVVLSLAVAVLLTVCARARAADLPHGVTCETIRSYVALHGKARALAWAVDQGYSWREIQAARRCLR